MYERNVIINEEIKKRRLKHEEIVKAAKKQEIEEKQVKRMKGWLEQRGFSRNKEKRLFSQDRAVK